MAEMLFTLDENGQVDLPVNATTDEANLTLFLQRLGLERAIESLQFVLDTLPAAVTAKATFVGPDGPLAGREVLVGNASGGTAKVDTLGLGEVSITMPTTTDPFTVTMPGTT